MDQVLVDSGIEQAFVNQAILAAKRSSSDVLSDRRLETIRRHARQSLRCPVARILSNESHRKFCIHLAESQLLQWFCGWDAPGVVRVPSKSTLQRMESEVPRQLLDRLNVLMLTAATQVDAEGLSKLGLEAAVDLSLVWMDSTCAKLDIHYPTDWTLLRDGTRSIMRAVTVIREHGLRHRMPSPKSFVAQMNQLAMAMSGASRRGRGGDKKRERKKALRAMKVIAGKVIRHGRRYLDLLKSEWSKTDLSQGQAQVIIDRLEKILAQMPAAIKQAHERIIGERVVPNDEKILSLYQPHARVYVRGKAGADAEFGLQMLLSESAEGLIIDCELVAGEIAADTELLIPAVDRIRAAFPAATINGVVTDRGFASKQNSERLGERGIHDATLPRNPVAMAEFLKDPKNRELHRRRAQTEARIGIFKGNFLGDHLPTKDYDHQVGYVAWATLAHNLWVLARLPTAPPERLRQAS
jgi:hypothetical protein